eukprot:2351930-Rhodomonas_salina.3
MALLELIRSVGAARERRVQFHGQRASHERVRPPSCDTRHAAMPRADSRCNSARERAASRQCRGRTRGEQR